MDTNELNTSRCSKLGTGIKQLDEKLAASEMREMIWSPKMDLVAAIGLADLSEVVLYRLHALKKMWTYSPPTEGAKVTSLVWDPIGKCIALAYTNNQVIILAVEKATVLYTHSTSSVPRKLTWLSVGEANHHENISCFKDESEHMLPKLPPIQRETEMDPSFKMINREGLNYLVVSGDAGLLNIYVYGLLLIASIDKDTGSLQEKTVCSSCLTNSGSHLVSVLEDSVGDIYLSALKTNLLSNRREEIRTIADKFVKIISLLEHCDASITKMTEAWEDGLLELDRKLNHFSTQKQLAGEGTVLNDFLELLLFGTPSEELKVFLTDTITERGMKKLGVTLQTYYKTMQELLTINMQGAVEAIFYHLNDLHGLSQWTDTFGIIGLNTDSVASALHACASLRLKINEMQGLLSNGNKNLKSFSYWLYTVILRISNLPVPDYYASIDYSDVADFLNDNFKGLEDHGSHIRLERVGQYLKDADLTCQPKPTDHSLWNTFQSCPNLSDSKFMFKAQPTKSLIQLYKQLSEKLLEALTTPSVTIAKEVEIQTTHKLIGKCELQKLRQFPGKDNDGIQNMYSIYLTDGKDNSESRLFVTKLALLNHGSELYKTELIFGLLGQDEDLYPCQQHRIVDFDYYQDEEIVVLLQQKMEGYKSFVTVRLNLESLTSQDWARTNEAVEAGKYVSPSYIKVLQNAFNAVQISASGKRDISSVMLSNRRVRLFIFDGEDDSDEEGESMSQDPSASADDDAISSDKEN